MCEWMYDEVLLLSNLRKHSIKDTGGRSRKKHGDALEGMYEEVVDTRRGERGMWRP